jgi:type VI secretion system secreted protein VgrG
MTAGKNISSSATMDISENAGENKSTTVGMMHSLSVGTDYMIHVIGKMTEYIKGNKESRTEKDRTRVSNGKIVAQSQGTHEQHSDKEVKNNSGEKTSMY